MLQATRRIARLNGVISIQIDEGNPATDGGGQAAPLGRSPKERKAVCLCATIRTKPSIIQVQHFATTSPGEQGLMERKGNPVSRKKATCASASRIRMEFGTGKDGKSFPLSVCQIGGRLQLQYGNSRQN